MIHIISGTHRNDSYTLTLSKLYMQLLEQEGLSAQIFSLQALPSSFFRDNSIFGSPTSDVENLLITHMRAPKVLVWICPEYNGSYPGLVKLLIDSCPPEWFKNKLSVLVGLGTGRSGNVKGMDHLTSVLHYLGSDVLPLKVPVSGIHRLVSKDGTQVDPSVATSLRQQITDLKSRIATFAQ